MIEATNLKMKKTPNILLGQSSLGKLSWEITSIKSLAKLPRGRTVPYRFSFLIHNHYDHSIDVRVHVSSPSNVLVFRKKTSKMMGRSRLKTITDTLGKKVEHTIPSQQNKIFQFSTIFRPHFAHPLQPFLVLQYRIYARNIDEDISFSSDPYRIKIPVNVSKT